MTKNSYLVRADARRFGRKVITTSTSVGEGSLFNEPELDEGERKETADQIRGGSATCDLARLRKWRLIFGCVTRGGRAPGVALDPWLLSCAPSGHSISGCAEKYGGRLPGLISLTAQTLRGRGSGALP
jgi:hypothetical protein